MEDSHQKNLAMVVHISTFSRFFIPFGSFLAPFIIWILNKDKSEFVDFHGKQIVNFQISILLYALLIGAISIPLILLNFFSNFNFNFAELATINIETDSFSPLLWLSVGGFGFLMVIAFIIELGLIIKASLEAKKGNYYNYPLTIQFIK